MNTSRAIIETPSGHVHVRSSTKAGNGDAIVLLHWTPASSRQFIPVLPLLADKGYDAYAMDHMGYGQSDPRPGPWAVEDYANNVAEVMAGLGLARATVAGGHFSSEIATELSLRHPGKVTRLVLDGSPVWDRAFREEVLSTARQPTPDWKEDGSHIAWVWERALWLQRMWDSDFELNDDGAALLRNAVIDSMLAQQSDDSAEALKNYDMEEALKKVSVPTLALTAETDPLNNCHVKVLDAVSGSVGFTFKGTHPLHDANKAMDYADVVDHFIRGDVDGLETTASTTQSTTKSYA